MAPKRGRPERGRGRRGGSREGAPRYGAPQGEHPKRPPAPPRIPREHDLVYGRNPVREALRGRRRVHRLWVVEAARAEVEGWIGGTVSLGGPPLAELPRDILDALAGAAEHQGVVAEVDAFPYAEPEAVLESASLVVALDRIQDPHNLGAVVRTADAAGAAVVIPRHRSADVTPAVVKAAAGATEHVAIARARNLTDVVARAKEAGFWVYGADAEAEAAYDAEAYPERVLLCLGSEGEGLGRRLAEACDVLVSIPLAGQVQSLNVSVAAGILLFEVRRQWRAGSG